MPGKLLSTAISNRLAGRPVPIHGDGLALREFTYVTDAVDGLLAAFEYGSSDARYVIGSGVRHSAVDAARIVNQVAGGDDDWLVWTAERPGCDQRYAVDSTKIRRDLGWSPAVDFEDGIQRTPRMVEKRGPRRRRPAPPPRPSRRRHIRRTPGGHGGRPDGG